MGSKAPAVGIDLGTTYSCIAYYQHNTVNIILNDADSRTTPSYVSFTEHGRVIGDEAKNRANIDLDHTLFGIKNLIGRYYEDPEVEICKKIYPYKIVNNKGKPNLSIHQNKEKHLFAPEEISGMILQKLKDDASRHFGKEVTKAVITVPAHFSDAQRQATKNAGRIAGLEVLKIINEPTAAALAYGIHRKYKNVSSEPTILVYDFGGGTFDVSIISVKEGIFEVKATNGLPHLGGDDIDVNLMHFFAQEFEKEYSLDLRKDPKAMRRLRTQAEKAKERLSSTQETDVVLDYLYQGEDFDYTLTRQKLVEINSEIFQKTIDCVDETLKDAKIGVEQIDEILLVGGSSRIPGVRQKLEEFFGKELNASLNPDEAVAMGAAIEAAILDGESSNQTQEMLLLDVCPLSLGLQVQGGVMSVIIPRNTTIPVEKNKSYRTTTDNQTSAVIVVYEGEGTLVKRNVKLGEFTIKDIPKAPKGQISFLVNFKVNSDGILEVTAFSNYYGVIGDLKVDSNTGRLTEEEITKMIEKGNKYKIQDELYKETILAKIDLESYCLEMKGKIKEAKLNEKDKEQLLKKCESTLSWLKGKNITKDEYLNKKKDLIFLYKPYFS